MADRIRHALALRGMTPSDLIRQRVLSKAGIYFLLDGTTKSDKVRADTVSKLCKALSVNREWLLNGRGSIDSVHEDEGQYVVEPASQPQRIDPEILAASIKLIRMTFEILGVEIDQEEDAEPTALAYAYLLERNQRSITADNVVDFSKFLKSRAQGEKHVTGDGEAGASHSRARSRRTAR